jgi:hypothetical protein
MKPLRSPFAWIPGLAALVVAAPPAPAAPAGPQKHSVDLCTYVAHGSAAAHKRDGKPSGGGGSGGPKSTNCSKTFAKWGTSTIDVWVDPALTQPTGGGTDVDATTLDAYARLAMGEWACNSALGETVAVNFTTTEADAEIKVTWGGLGSTGILGQTTTYYSPTSGLISSSTVVMNNAGGFTWTKGADPTHVSGCIDEESNDPLESRYDLFSVLLHELGHAIGMSHPTNRCSGTDACYAQTMYSCTDSGEYMRRTLESGDILSVVSKYGAP